MKINVDAAISVIHTIMNEITDKATVGIKNAKSVEEAREIRVIAEEKLDICRQIVNSLLALI